MGRGPTDPDRIERLLHALQQGLDRLYDRLLSTAPTLERPATDTPPGPPAPVAAFTAQQRLFIQLACREEEFTVDEIAAEMGIRPSTVKQHARAVYRKLNVRTRQGLVIVAARHRLIPLWTPGDDPFAGRP